MNVVSGHCGHGSREVRLHPQHDGQQLRVLLGRPQRLAVETGHWQEEERMQK